MISRSRQTDWMELKTDDEGDQSGYERSQRQNLPVVLEDEHTEEFAEIYAALRKPSVMTDPFGHAVTPPSEAASAA